MVACGPGDSEEARRGARLTVESFFSALEDGDSESIARVAPDLPLDGAMLDDLRSAMREGESTIRIEEISIEGTTALVSVLLKQGDGGGEDVELLVPLSWQDSRWVVEDSITVQKTIDFVPVK